MPSRWHRDLCPVEWLAADFTPTKQQDAGPLDNLRPFCRTNAGPPESLALRSIVLTNSENTVSG